MLSYSDPESAVEVQRQSEQQRLLLEQGAQLATVAQIFELMYATKDGKG